MAESPLDEDRVRRAAALVRERRFGEAEAVASEVADDAGPVAARALLVKAIAVDGLSGADGAMAVLDQLTASSCVSDATLARALEFRARLLARTSPEAAAQQRAALVERLGSSEDVHARVIVARAVVRNARALEVGGDWRGAVALLDGLVARYAGVPAADRPDPVVEAGYMRAGLLAGARLDDAALDAASRFSEEYGGVASPLARRLTAHASFLEATLLARAGHRDTAIARMDTALDRHADAVDKKERLAVARAMTFRAALLATQGSDTAVGAWSEVIDRFRTDPPAGEPLILLEALSQRAIAAARSGDDARAVADIDELESRGSPRSSAPADVRAAALAGVVAPWLVFGRVEQALTAVRSLNELWRNDRDPGVGHHLLAATRELARAGLLEDASAALEDLLGLDPEAAGPAARALLAAARFEASQILARQGRVAAAAEAYESIFSLGADALPMWDDAALAAEPDADRGAQRLAEALLGRAVTLQTIARGQDARETYQDIIDRFAQSDDNVLQRIVHAARQACDQLDSAR